MSKTTNKPFNLEERTFEFSRTVLFTCKNISRNTLNHNLIEQLLRSVTSVGANYREANEAVSKRDFVHRIKIARKECKETTYWLSLLKAVEDKLYLEIDSLVKESQELRNIFTAILEKINF